jgi:hypothetical protein
VSSEVVVFRGGLVASWTIVARLLELEARGCSFRLEPGGRFRVTPPDLLTADDRAFLRTHQAECRQVVAYNADGYGRPA